MIDELITNIVNAETSAENIVKESQQKAKDIVSKAKEDSLKKFELEKQKIEYSKQEKSRDATYVAERKNLQAQEDCKKTSYLMQKKADEKMSEAVDLIVEKLKEKYDC